MLAAMTHPSRVLNLDMKAKLCMPKSYIYIYIFFLSIAVWIDEQKFESHKRVTIYGRVLDYYSHLLIFIAPIPSNIMFAAFWLFSYSRIECQCLHGIIHLLLGISFQS